MKKQFLFSCVVLATIIGGCKQTAEINEAKVLPQANKDTSAASVSDTEDTVVPPDAMLVKLISLLGIEEDARTNLSRMIQDMKQVAPSVPEEFWIRFEKEADTHAYVEMAYQVYPKYLSKEDLQCLVAFHESDTGKKMKQENQAMATEIHSVAFEWGKELGQRIRARLDGEKEKKGKTPKVKKKDSAAANDIREMMRLSGTAELSKLILEQMIQNLKQVRPDLDEKIWDEFRTNLDMDEMLELMIPVVEKHYSPEDVKAIIVFYSSDCGKKLNSVQGQISQEMMILGQAWGAKLGAAIEQKLKAEQQEQQPGAE